jgi:hypothetical protein
LSHWDLAGQCFAVRNSDFFLTKAKAKALSSVLCRKIQISSILLYVENQTCATKFSICFIYEFASMYEFPPIIVFFLIVLIAFNLHLEDLHPRGKYSAFQTNISWHGVKQVIACKKASLWSL